jgi:aldehyde dehydrogenase (NAD+)
MQCGTHFGIWQADRLRQGIPDGVVNIITGHGDPCGRELTSHPLVARVSFTGGPVSAGHVIRNTAENFAELSLELGGKSPFIVFDDADIDSAVNGSVAGIFAASGQSCVAGSRLYLHDAIADSFLAKMTAIANSIRIGDPQAEDTQMGPLCTSAQIDHIETQVARAVEQGGRILAGGSRVDGMDGLFFQPTIIECPDPSMEIVDTELFGPVLAVLRFSDEDDVIAQANHSVHGLAAGLFTRDSGPVYACGAASSCRHCVGEYLPGHFADCRIRWQQAVRLWAGKRHAGGI